MTPAVHPHQKVVGASLHLYVLPRDPWQRHPPHERVAPHPQGFTGAPGSVPAPGAIPIRVGRLPAGRIVRPRAPGGLQLIAEREILDARQREQLLGLLLAQPPARTTVEDLHARPTR